MRRRLELRDMRSLERRSMYSIFHPLDPDERLPRELMLEGRRHRLAELRLMEVLGFTYIPALVLGVLAIASLGVKPVVAFGLVGLVFAGFFLFVLRAKYR